MVFTLFINYFLEVGTMGKRELGRILRERRKQLTLTQDEIAKRLNYKTKDSISKIEMGTSEITVTKLYEYAEALETTVQELLEIKVQQKAIAVEINSYDKKPLMAFSILVNEDGDVWVAKLLNCIQTNVEDSYKGDMMSRLTMTTNIEKLTNELVFSN